MGELEQQVLELEMENQKLCLENRLLLEKTSDLITENEELRQRLGFDALEEDEDQAVESGVGSFGVGIGSSESAVLRLCVPPQQVQAQQSSSQKSLPWTLAVLALQTLSLISCLASWTSSTQSSSSRAALQQRSPKTASSCCLQARRDFQYAPPHLQLWGPHQLSWRPIMN